MFPRLIDWSKDQQRCLSKHTFSRLALHLEGHCVQRADFLRAAKRKMPHIPAQAVFVSICSETIIVVGREEIPILSLSCTDGDKKLPGARLNFRHKA